MTTKTVFDIYDPEKAAKEELSIYWAAASDTHPQSVGMMEAQGFQPMTGAYAKKLGIPDRFVKADNLVHVGANIGMVMDLKARRNRDNEKRKIALAYRQRPAEELAEKAEELGATVDA
jgi:hypothetical protein